MTFLHQRDTIVPMRNMLLGFMTILMLTPLLTCAMPFCPMKTAMAGEHKPCHHQSEESKKGTAPMLILDCMGLDLFQSDIHADIPHPDHSIDLIDFVWADITADYNVRPVAIHTIRAPPGSEGNPPNGTALILTTQRFRI